MKVTYNWLKDFVDIALSPEALADKLTMAGLEVTSLEEKGGDFVIEIEITSNRPDWLSVIGIAREVAAITGRKLKLPHAGAPVKNARRSPGPGQLSIRIEDKKDCPLYTAKVIEGVNVLPSPAWLQKRLELVGCRSVNAVVDVTNYILFETGHPLHAFDYDKLDGQELFVRRAKNNEKIITLDGVERLLNAGMLVIADRRKAIAIAGVMGGKNTEVTHDTKNVLLEAAVFSPVIVRRMRQALGIQSESSYRFERGVPCASVAEASQKAVLLIQELGKGSYAAAKSSGLFEAGKKPIEAEAAQVNEALGIKIASSTVKRILESLGCNVRIKSKHIFKVTPPLHRQDIVAAVDIIEEIARIIGYERIPTTIPAVTPQIMTAGREDAVSTIKSVLAGLGLNEVITNSLVDSATPAYSRETGANPIEIANPLSQEQAVLRTSLIPGLARCISLNLNQQQEYIAVFEIAKIFSRIQGRAKEELMLGVALSGMKSFWLTKGQVRDKVGFLHLKGVLGVLCERLGIKDWRITSEPDGLLTLLVRKAPVATLAKLETGLLEHAQIKNTDVFVVEIPLEKLLSGGDFTKRFVPLPLYPPIARDISFSIRETTEVDAVLQAIGKNAPLLLKEVRVIDCYAGTQIPSGFKGLTVSCLYRSDERTLTEEEIAPLHTLISETLVKEFDARLR